jgi:hypothetical protein
MMGAVLACAVGLAALRNANEVWAGALMLMTLALVGAAVLGVIHQREVSRARWLGCLLFTGGYLVLAFGPWFSEQIGPALATTQVLGYAHMWATSSPVPRSSKYRELLDRREALLAKFQEARRLSRSQSDPTVVAVGRQVAALEGQIAAIQGLPLPATSRGAAGQPPAPPNRWQALIPGAANYDQFLRVGHCLFALLAGVGGAVISTRLYSKRERQPAPDGGTPGL